MNSFFHPQSSIHVNTTMQDAFSVYRWKDGAHVENMYFVPDVPIPIRKALERGDFGAAEGYVPAHVLQEAHKLTLKNKLRVRWAYTAIYPDDRADVACKKVLYELLDRRRLQAGDTMASWRASGPVLFSLKNEDGERVPNPNPFRWKANANVNANALTRIPHDNAWIGTAPMNVVLAADMPGGLPKEAESLFFWTTDYTNVKTTVQQERWLAEFAQASTNIGGPLYSPSDLRFVEITWRATHDRALSLEAIFERIRTHPENAPLVQWVDDRHHVLYKLNRKHTLSKAQLDAFMEYERAPLTSAPCLTIFTKMGRMVLASNTIELRVRPNAIVGVDAFRKFEKETLAWANETLGMRSSWKYANGLIRLLFAADTTPSALTNAISKFTSFVSAKKLVGRNAFVLQWLRASNYKANVDIATIISTRLKLGVDSERIVEDLVDIHGIGMIEARSLVEDAEQRAWQMLENAETREAAKARMVAAVGMTITLLSSPRGIEVTLRDVPSEEDVHQALFWLQGMTKVVLKKANSPGPSQEQPPAQEAKVQEAKPLQLKELEDDPFALSNSSSDSSKSSSRSKSSGGQRKLRGGGNNFIIDLQRADPALFGKTYSKKCQSASNSQPVVMSPAEFAALPEKYKATLQNHLTYGSDTNVERHNVFYCPSVWCDGDRVPMSHKQYVDNGSQCPNGQPGKQMWDIENKKKDPERKLYIGFVGKSVTVNEGPCMPCCYLNPPKPNVQATCMARVRGEVATEAESSNKASARHLQQYLLTHDAPLKHDRWGTLPRAMHVVLHPPSVLHGQCKYSQSNKPCLLRHGILHHKDSFMHALGYIMTGKINAKGALLRMLRDVIKPEVFVTLENGLVLAAFALEDVAYTQTPLAKWTAWIMKPEQAAYRRIFRVDASITGLRLARELAIYAAYERFHTYLASTETKDVSLLVDVARHLGVHLIVWERDANDANVARLRCPANVPYKALALESHEPHVGILLHDHGYFEPIELGAKAAIRATQESTTKHAIPDKLATIMSECDAALAHVPDALAWVEAARCIDAAARLVTAEPTRFIWRRAIVSPDFCIVGLGNSEGVVACGRVPMSALVPLLEVFPHLVVVHQEDVRVRMFAAQEGDVDAAVFEKLLDMYGADRSDLVIDAPPIFALRLSGELAQQKDADWEAHRKWRATRWMVGRELIKNFSASQVKVGREEFVANHRSLFPTLAKFVEEALREVPYESKAAIEAWMTETQRESWPFLSRQVQAHGTTWLFSQLAVERGLPAHVLKPISGARPRTHVLSVSEYVLTWLSQEAGVKTNPSAPQNAEPRKLPWKWADARKYSWREWTGAMPTAADATNFLLQYLLGVAHACDIKISAHMVQLATLVYVTNTVASDAKGVEAYAKAPGLLEIFKDECGLPKANPAKIAAHLMTKPMHERRAMLERIVRKAPMGDINIDLFARWSGVTVMVVANVDYAKADESIGCKDYRPTIDRLEELKVCSDGPPEQAKAPYVRGSTKDLVSSAALFCDESTARELTWKRPFVWLYKEVANGNARYGPIGSGWWPSLRHAPKDLQHVACCLWKHKSK